MPYFPIFQDSQSIRCLLIGGGDVAHRKLKVLLSRGVKPTIVASDVNSHIENLSQSANLPLRIKPFDASDIDDHNLVVAATDESAINEQVSQICRSRDIPINVVDNVELSTFIFPSIVDRDPVIVAASTSAACPSIAVHLRNQLEEVLPANLGAFTNYLKLKRQTLQKQGKQKDHRFWKDVVDSPILELLSQQKTSQADQLFDELDQASQQTRGLVAIVGAGPGDPDLLTLKALNVLQKADVVYFDNLVSKEILNRARRDAAQVYVGKRRQYHTVRQAQINEWLIRDAKAGKYVVRLKGGDPFLFGRGGEELASVLEQQVDFIVVPGITAALGCASYAGIPLTYRGLSQSVRFITGSSEGGEVQVDWPELAKSNQTLVIYMGLHRLSEIITHLLNANMAADTPIAIISRGTFEDQKVAVATLNSIITAVEAHPLRGPTTMIIGEVVNLRGRFNHG